MQNLYYPIICLVALIVHLIVNSKYIIVKDSQKESVAYRNYLISLSFFFLTDFAWGILYNINVMNRLLYIDTILYYILMSFSVLLCCRYIIAFLRLNRIAGVILDYIGMTFVFAGVVVLAINHFHHIFFWIDADGSYHSYFFRNLAIVTLYSSYAVLFCICFVVYMRTRGKMRSRNLVICFCAFVMTIALILQKSFPLIPIYGLGLMFTTLIIHVFIYNEEINDKIKTIESLNRKLSGEHGELHKHNDELTTALAVINKLSYEYQCIWWANKDDMKIHNLRVQENSINSDALKVAMEAADCNDAMNFYIEHYVVPDDRERMHKEVNTKEVLRRLEHEDFYVINYKRLTPKGEVEYNQMAFANSEGVDGKQRLIFGFRDISYIFKHEQAMKRLNESIASNEAKTRFLQNMSHEIRTPLNAMFGFAQLLGLPDGSWTDEEKTQYNSYIYNSYEMLDMLISDIIDIADSEHGNYQINISDVNVNAVCRNALMSVEYRVPANVKLYMTSDLPEDYTIKSDTRRIQQVLINYLTNACKNTQRGEIHLHCSNTENPGRITFSVADTGPGVPKEKADLIFNRFTKLNQFVQGSGLGLNICQMVASKLGGDVYLDTTYTEGARFVFVVNA